MKKKIIFWIYAAVGPLFIVLMTFGESLWPIRIPVDYMYAILVGIPSMVASLILMIIEAKFLSRHKWLNLFIPAFIYLGFASVSLFFADGRYGWRFIGFYILVFVLIYTLVTHLTLWVYRHWVCLKQEPTDETSEPLPPSKKIKNGVFKVIRISTVSFILVIWPILWFSMILIFNSEVMIHYRAYQYENDPTSENLAELTKVLINYRGYKERLVYLPKAMNDQTVLQILYDNWETDDRSSYYSIWGEPNTSYALSLEDAKALIMSQYINAYLFLDRNDEYLDLMKTRTEQYGTGTFYYMFVGNVMMGSSEYKPKLQDLLVLWENIYDHIEIKDKTDYWRRFYNIRSRQSIYFLLGEDENYDRLEIQFNQVIEEMKAYVDAQENK